MKKQEEKKGFVWYGLRCSFWISMISLCLIIVSIVLSNFFSSLIIVDFMFLLWYSFYISTEFMFIISIIHLFKYKEKRLATISLIFCLVVTILPICIIIFLTEPEINIDSTFGMNVSELNTLFANTDKKMVISKNDIVLSKNDSIRVPIAVRNTFGNITLNCMFFSKNFKNNEEIEISYIKFIPTKFSYPKLKPEERKGFTARVITNKEIYPGKYHSEITFDCGGENKVSEILYVTVQ